MYIPVVVAMAASQNVAAAAAGGLLALVAGSGAVIVSFALVPVLSRIGSNPSNGTNAGDKNQQGAADKSDSESGAA